MDSQECIDKLKRAIVNILCFVSGKNSMNIETVAIPALSPGIFQFPLNLCTEIIVQTIKIYFQSMPIANNLKEIHLVSNEDPTVAAFKNASEIILGRNELESLVSQGATQPFNTMVVNSMTLQIVQGLIERQEVSLCCILLHCQRGSLNCVLPSKYVLSIYYFKHGLESILFRLRVWISEPDHLDFNISFAIY